MICGFGLLALGALAQEPAADPTYIGDPMHWGRVTRGVEPEFQPLR